MDARHYAVVQIEAQPAKRLSFWLNFTDTCHVYAKSGDSWLHRHHIVFRYSTRAFSTNTTAGVVPPTPPGAVFIKPSWLRQHGSDFSGRIRSRPTDDTLQPGPTLRMAGRLLLVTNRISQRIFDPETRGRRGRGES